MIAGITALRLRWAAGLEKGLHGLKEIQRATHLFDEAAPRVGRGALRFDMIIRRP